VEGYSGNAEGERDPEDLSIQRTPTFREHREICAVSTTKLKGHSRLKAASPANQSRQHRQVPALPATMIDCAVLPTTPNVAVGGIHLAATTGMRAGFSRCG
jgi:hypothetical protein